MLTLLLALSARADEPTTTAAAESEAPAASESIDIGTISLTGDVAVPEVVIFTPRITTQEASVETLSALIDARIAEAAEQK